MAWKKMGGRYKKITIYFDKATNTYYEGKGIKRKRVRIERFI